MKYLIVIFSTMLLFSCNKQEGEIGEAVEEFFTVKTGKTTHPILVKGNTASKVFLIYIHGGPGDPGIWEHNTPESAEYIQPHYAAVYFDQPYAGFSQGNNWSGVGVREFRDALDGVVETIKNVYGNDNSIFILGHSWGGFVSSAYLTKGNNQDKIKGWINMSGSHNYSLNDTLVGDKIREVGQMQIDAGIDVSTWQSMIDWVNANPPDGTSKRSNDINSMGFDGANMMEDSLNDGFQLDAGKIILGQYQPWAMTSFATNLISTNILNLNQLALDNEMSSALSNVTIPVLNLYGKYDFIVPKGLGDDVMNRVSSTWKKMVIFPKSDHNPQLQEPEACHAEMRAFIETFK